MLLLTADQHREVAKNLLLLSKKFDNVKMHAAGIEYTSLMICFLLHNKTATSVLLQLFETSKEEWFPVTVGYQIVRSMFEVDINAHYITKDPQNHARKYIEYETILDKKEMEACRKHLNSNNNGWKEATNYMWKNKWSILENEIDKKFNKIKGKYQKRNKKGRIETFNNWSGKSLRQMAIEANHEEPYDIFYSDLSSFTHVDVRLVNRFLKMQPENITWSARSNEYDYAAIFRYASVFFECFLELFSEQFCVSSKDEIRKCWNINKI